MIHRDKRADRNVNIQHQRHHQRLSWLSDVDCLAMLTVSRACCHDDHHQQQQLEPSHVTRDTTG